MILKMCFQLFPTHTTGWWVRNAGHQQDQQPDYSLAWLKPLTKHLVAAATWSTGLASVLTIDVVSWEKGVGWAFLALIGFLIYIISSRTWHTGWARLLRFNSTSPACPRHTILSVRYSNWVDLCHVVGILASLKETNFLLKIFICYFFNFL